MEGALDGCEENLLEWWNKIGSICGTTTRVQGT
jgi:hypothetical protein